VQAIERQTQVVEEEADVVSTAGQLLEKIRGTSTQSSQLVLNISQIAREQSEGTQNVVRAMEQITRIAKQTQTGAQTTVAAIDTLIAQSSKLTESIGRFRIS